MTITFEVLLAVIENKGQRGYRPHSYEVKEIELADGKTPASSMEPMESPRIGLVKLQKKIERAKRLRIVANQTLNWLSMASPKEASSTSQEF